MTICKQDYPFTGNLLNIILDDVTLFLDSNQGQQYLAKLYRAMFAVSYYGLLCIWEITSGDHPILAKDMQVATNKNKMLLILRTSKTHWKDNKPQLVKIISSKHKRNSKYCPFKILRDYITLRGNRTSINEVFFIFRDKSPVKPYHFRQMLQIILRHNKYNAKLYNTMSFLCRTHI